MVIATERQGAFDLPGYPVVAVGIVINPVYV
jgi:hypothetical protein